MKVGFIGLTLEGTPNIVSAAGIQDVNFLDEATTINAAADDLRSQGVKTIVVLLHEGGAQSVSLNPNTIDTCTGMSGAIVDIVQQPDPAVDMVVSGHTHNAYNCLLPKSDGNADPGQQRVLVRPPGDRHRHEDQLARADGRCRSPSTTRSSSVTTQDPAEAASSRTTRRAVAPIANAVVG